MYFTLKIDIDAMQYMYHMKMNYTCIAKSSIPVCIWILNIINIDYFSSFL